MNTHSNSDFCDIRNIIKAANGQLALLLGNGLSVKIDNHFNYGKLSEKADPEVKSLFKSLEVASFEEILKSLITAGKISEFLKFKSDETKKIQCCYDAVKSNFIKVLKEIHPLKSKVGEKIGVISGELKNFQRVFTTNYDLLIYWSMMKDPHHFTDRFNNGQFEKKDYTSKCGDGCDNPKTRTHVYYLHGALHLYDKLGETRKLQGDIKDNLLELIEKEIHLNKVFPVYIAEGDPGYKLRKIETNPYLKRCWEIFEENHALDKIDHILPLIVFGHRLDEKVDKHIIDTIIKSKIGEVYYGISPNKFRKEDDKTIEMARIKKLFDNSNHTIKINFFKSDELFVDLHQ